MPSAPDSQVLAIIDVCHHVYLSKQLSFSPFYFTYNEIGIGESVETKQLAQGHWVARLVLGLAFS